MANFKLTPKKILMILSTITSVLLTGLLMAFLIGTAESELGIQNVMGNLWFSWTWFAIFIGGTAITVLVTIIISRVLK